MADQNPHPFAEAEPLPDEESLPDERPAESILIRIETAFADVEPLSDEHVAELIQLRIERNLNEQRMAELQTENNRLKQENEIQKMKIAHQERIIHTHQQVCRPLVARVNAQGQTIKCLQGRLREETERRVHNERRMEYHHCQVLQLKKELNEAKERINEMERGRDVLIGCEFDVGVDWESVASSWDSICTGEPRPLVVPVRPKKRARYTRRDLDPSDGSEVESVALYSPIVRRSGVA